MQAVATGKSNKEIGVALDISEGTVKVHITHILEKLKARMSDPRRLRTTRRAASSRSMFSALPGPLGRHGAWFDDHHEFHQAVAEANKR